MAASLCVWLIVAVLVGSAQALIGAGPSLTTRKLHLAFAEAGQVKAAHRKRGACWDAEVWGSVGAQLSPVMCRKSRVIFGNVQPLANVAQALEKGRCIKVAAIGGSITQGKQAGVIHKDSAWPHQLERWLNKLHPCQGKGHRVSTVAVDAVGSDFWADQLLAWKADLQTQSKRPNWAKTGRSEMSAATVWEADLVIVDSGSNDIARGSENEKKRERVGLSTELLVRQLLEAPKRPALVWLQASWRGFGKLQDQNRQPPFHTDAARVHQEVMEYYDIPMVSTLHALLPLSDARRREWVDREFFADEVHPTDLGHILNAQLLGHAIEEAGAPESSGAAWFEPEQPAVGLPTPLFAAQATADLYSKAVGRMVRLWNADETRPLVLQNRGWDWHEDVPGKPGLIATAVNSELLIQHQLERPDAGRPLFVNVGMLRSYEHMGFVRIELLLPPRGSGPSTTCQSSEAAKASVVATAEMDGLWSEHVSVFDAARLSVKPDKIPPAASCMWLRFKVVDPTKPHGSRQENKVKLLEIIII